MSPVLGDNVLHDAPEILEQIADTLDELNTAGDTGTINMAIFARTLGGELSSVAKSVYRRALEAAMELSQPPVEPIEPPQLAEIRGLWLSTGFPTIDGRAEFIAAVVDREVSKTADLSKEEAAIVIEALHRRAEEPF